MFTEEKLVLMVFSVVWIAGVFICRKFYAARAWPSVEGVITKSALEWQSGSGSTNGGYTMDVEYEYVVNGRKYVKNGLRLGWKLMMSFKRFMDKRLAAFPVGKQVSVTYNPQKPKESFVIAPDPDKVRLLLAVMAIVLSWFWMYYS
ncbi:MAG: DUF3592 domain-containing protein [Gammaproteobacteria bacterium]|nr:DUF3592 domain-containing protein [Gammaproteobacteria bacterium]